MITITYAKLKVDTTCGSGLIVEVKATLPHHDENLVKGLMSWIKIQTTSFSFPRNLEVVLFCGAAKLQVAVQMAMRAQSSTWRAAHRSTQRLQSHKLQVTCGLKSQKYVKANFHCIHRAPLPKPVGARLFVEGVS